MTGIVFVIGFIVFLVGACAFLPLGILSWLWLALQNPHQVMQIDFSFNVAIVIACVIGLVTHRRRAGIWMDGTMVLMTALLLHTALTTFMAYNPEYSYPYFDRLWKTMALGGFIAFFMQNRTRIQAMVWVMVFSIGMLAFKGAAFSILTAGQFRVYGPIGTQITDNNHFAGAICMTIPLCFYLVATTTNPLLKTGLRVLGWSLPLAALFTYSRGGLIALLAVGLCYFLQARRKVPIAAVAVAAFFFLVPLMPSHWLDRMSTISETVGDTKTADESIQGRFNAWYVYTKVAMDRPLIGGGFRAPEVLSVWQMYLMQSQKEGAKAAHNNIFQVLGEHGFLGLAIYLTLVLLAFKNVAAVIVGTRHVPELNWAKKLATACGISLVAYMAAGLTMSIPYYDLFIVLAVLVALLRRLVAMTLAQRQTSMPTRAAGYAPPRIPPVAGGSGPQPSMPGGAVR
jgi:putative inorganic carbon (hco3(-)) transporter